MSDRIQKSIDLKASVDQVWDALTDHHQFGAWFRVRLEAPFEVGKEARGQITYPGWEHITMTVTVRRITPKSLFAFNWLPYALDPAIDYSGETPTLVTFTLTATATGTRLTVTEDGFDKVPQFRRAEAFRMNDSGWAQQMTNIQAHVGG